MPDTEVLIAEFDKNRQERVRVRFTEYKGYELVDIRTFYHEGEEWKPGKGIALKRELLPTLREALQAAEQMINENVTDRTIK